MADETQKQVKIVMEKVPEDRQPEAALFLSGCFSLPQTSTRGIAASGPIALISDIGRKQADAIMAELEPALPEGIELVVRAANDANVSRLQWPRPPRIYGRDLDEFTGGDESRDMPCPHCGGMVRVAADGGSLKAVGAERRRGETVARPAPSPDTDQDPLFSGVKPLAKEASQYASLRSLQAGDTGFWMDYGKNAPPQEPAPAPQATGQRSGDTSYSKRIGGRNGAGLSAFMKPGVFAVVVGRTRDSQTVKMIAEIMGIGEADARDQALSLGLCVARDIALDEAQTLLARFRNLGARARIVKPM